MTKKHMSRLRKQRLPLLIVAVVILGVGITGATLLLSKPKQTASNSKYAVVEQTPEVTDKNTTKEVPDTTVDIPKAIEESDTPAQQATPATPEKTVYEKYGVNQSIAQQFEAYYPTYVAYNKDLFVSNAATIVNAVGEDNAERFLDNHVRSTGLKGRTDGSKEAEKNSFFRLIIGGGSYNFNLSWGPWSTVI